MRLEYYLGVRLEVGYSLFYELLRRIFVVYLSRFRVCSLFFILIYLRCVLFLFSNSGD